MVDFSVLRVGFELLLALKLESVSVSDALTFLLLWQLPRGVLSPQLLHLSYNLTMVQLGPTSLGLAPLHLCWVFFYLPGKMPDF